MSKVSEYFEPHIYFPMDFPIPDEPGEGDCPHEKITRNAYYKMRTEMWKISELEYACLCVMESFDDEGYDKKSDDVVECVYGYSDNSAQNLIEEAEYVLNTFYEEGHVRNEWQELGTLAENKECLKEIRAIRRWLKKWKPMVEGK
tara:strand:- start:107 stop:541 length:435 start_codon:yes stop_codon:yes gene_type:complete